jgi:transposase
MAKGVEMADEKNNKVTTREFLAERDLRMFKMRQAGVAHHEIAKRFGVSPAVVSKAINRQLEKLNREALMAYPEVLRMELERLDALQQSIWPMTQHRRVTMDDGTEVQVEPDMKAIQQVLSIMDRRAKLLGMEQNNVNIQMDVAGQVTENIRVSLAGENAALPVSTFSPETEARQLLEIMVKSGVLAGDEVRALTQQPVIEAEVVSDTEDEQE